MSFFKRKEQNAIPPVESDQKESTPPGPGSSNGYGRYNSAKVMASFEAKTQPFDGNDGNDGNDSTYARRNRYTARESGPELPEPVHGQETEEDVEGIKQQIRATKQESVNSTRNALRLAREAEETALGTLLKLGGQSEKLANTERHLDISKNHSLRAEDNTDELKKLNQSIFRPSYVINKEAKRAAKELKIQARYDEDREERERTLKDVRGTHGVLGSAAPRDEGDNRRELTGAQQAMRKEQRSKYQFESTQSDEEAEDELDDNLGEIGEMAKRLKSLGTAMGQELDNQNHRIDRINEKATSLDNRMFRNTERLKRVK